MQLVPSGGATAHFSDSAWRRDQALSEDPFIALSAVHGAADREAQPRADLTRSRGQGSFCYLREADGLCRRQADIADRTVDVAVGRVARLEMPTYADRRVVQDNLRTG
jgi:hypothetical protein